jgi:hypothetical protein
MRSTFQVTSKAGFAAKGPRSIKNVEAPISNLKLGIMIIFCCLFPTITKNTD